MWDVTVGDGHAVVYDDARGRGWTVAIFAGGRPVVEERDVGPRAAAMERALSLLVEHALASAHELAAMAPTDGPVGVPEAVTPSPARRPLRTPTVPGRSGSAPWSGRNGTDRL